MHYTESFHRAVPEPDWFRFSLPGLALAMLGLQFAAFLVTSGRGGSARGRALA